MIRHRRSSGLVRFVEVGGHINSPWGHGCKRPSMLYKHKIITSSHFTRKYLICFVQISLRIQNNVLKQQSTLSILSLFAINLITIYYYIILLIII